MSSSHSLTSIDVSEYDRIEAAMSESERGRWFLDAYLRRNRAHDTGILLDAIGRLESAVTGERGSDQLGRLRGDVMDMAHAIARTKSEIAAISAPDHDQTRLGGASAALDAIVRSTERATSDILGAAEQVQEAAWTLREAGSDADLCDTLDRHATTIYTACSFQDLTAQRTARIIHTLRYLEERLAAMMAIWGDVLETVPPAPGEARSAEVPSDLCQSDVDRYLDMEAAGTVAAVATLAPDHADVAADEPFTFGQDAGTDADPVPERAAFDPETGDEFAEPKTAAAEAEDPDLGRQDDRATAPYAPEDASRAIEAEAASPIDADDLLDAIALRIASASGSADTPEQTDVASAFADIDGLSDEERRALFS